MTKQITNSFKIIAILWAILIADIIIPIDLNQFGIIPRTIIGLRGIFLAPLLHSNLFHLISNTIPLFVLLIVINSFYSRISFQVIFLSVFFSGIFIWIFARSGVHIGASGLIYSLAAFLIASGIFRKSIKSLFISLVIIFLYGGLVWGVLPTKFRVSWEGHLIGALVGIFLAYIYRDNDKQVTSNNT